MDEGMTVNFDFDQFYSLLYSASKSSFLEIQSRHPEDDFYYFALITCGDLNDVFASAGSEEGLTNAARRYYEMGLLYGFNLPDQREALRWSEGDSPYFGEMKRYFDAVDALLIPAVEALDNAMEDEYDVYQQSFLAALVAVLKQLDAEGVFGSNEQRDKITLCILMGDQSHEDRLKYVEQLNPQSVVDRFRQQDSRVWTGFWFPKPDPARTPQGTKKLFERANQLFNEGNYPLARPLYEQILVNDWEAAAAEDAETARVLTCLAKTLSRLGEFRNAEVMIRKALETRSQLFGPIHADTAESQHVLGEILSDLGNISLGREMTEQAYQVRRQILGPDHVDTLESQVLLALLLNIQGKVDLAEELLAEALNVCKTALIEQSWTAAKVLNAIGILKAKRAETRLQSLQMYEQSLAIHERIHPFHPETAMLLNNLATCLADQGELDCAARLGEQSLLLHEQLYGSNNVRLVPVLVNLAGIYKKLKVYDAALPLYERALILSEPVLGARHPQTMRSLKKLVGFYSLLKEGNYRPDEQQLWTNAMILYTCMVSLQAAEGSLPPEMREMPGAHLNPEEAERLLHETVFRLKTERERQPLSAGDLAKLQSARQLLLNADRAFDRGEYALAQSSLEKALEIQGRILGEKHYKQIEPLQKLIKIKEKLGQPSAVLPLLERIVDVHIQAFGPENPQTLSAMTARYNRYVIEYGIQAALPLAEQNVQLQEKALGADDPNVRMMKVLLERLKADAKKEGTPAQQTMRSRSQKREDALRSLPPEREAVLAGIEAIPWHDIHHAYGPADDIPDQLRMLLSDDPEVQGDAWELLFSNICHQGDVWEATPYTIPFFLRMLAYEGPPPKMPILSMLITLVVGRSSFDQDFFSPEEKIKWQERLKKRGIDLETEINKVRKAVEAINQAACEGIPLYFDLLDHPDPEVRIAAFTLLGTLRGRSEQIVPRLQMLFGEISAADERRAVLSELGTQMDESSASQQFFGEIMLSDPSSYCRFSAAVALVKRAGVNTPDQAVQAILNGLYERAQVMHQERQQEVGRQEWGFSELVWGAEVLAKLGLERAVSALEALMMATHDRVEAPEIANLLLGVVFNRDDLSLRQPGIHVRGKDQPPGLVFVDSQHKPANPITASDLTSIQIKALKVILAHDPGWICEHDFLTLYGLPGTRLELEYFLPNENEESS
jgi:tetratricopeptide (TPR) repeat protein